MFYLLFVCFKFHKNKTVILLSFNCVSTTVWLNHISNEMLEDKKLDRNYTGMMRAVLKSWSCSATSLPSHMVSKLEE